MENQEKKKSSEVRQDNRPYRRRVRNILIHKPMQREFTFVMISLLMVSTLAVGFVIHQTIREAAFGGGFQFGKINPYDILSEVSYQLIMRVSAVLFLTLIIIGVFGVFFLHRVAGPVYRFRQIFMRINDGEFPKFVRLREGDFFSETASEINQLVNKLRFDYERDRAAKQQLQQIIEKAKNPGAPVQSELVSLKELMEKRAEVYSKKNLTKENSVG